MSETDTVKAACCLAGTDSEVTVEELKLLRDLGGSVGLEQDEINSLIDKARRDTAFRAEQTDLLMSDVDESMKELIRLAQESRAHDDGYVAMLMWRVAMQLDVSAERFEELLAG